MSFRAAIPKILSHSNIDFYTWSLCLITLEGRIFRREEIVEKSREKGDKYNSFERSVRYRSSSSVVRVPTKLSVRSLQIHFWHLPKRILSFVWHVRLRVCCSCPQSLYIYSSTTGRCCWVDELYKNVENTKIAWQTHTRARAHHTSPQYRYVVSIFKYQSKGNTEFIDLHLSRNRVKKQLPRTTTRYADPPERNACSGQQQKKIIVSL